MQLHVVGVGRRAEAGVKQLLAFGRGPSGEGPFRGRTPKRTEDGHSPSDQLLLLGFAGAVDPALSTGDLSVATRYYVAEGETPPTRLYERGRMASGSFAGNGPADSPSLAQRVCTNNRSLSRRGVRGVFLKPDQKMWRLAANTVDEADLPSTQLDSLTVDHLVATPAEKQALRQQYNIGVINMEDYRVAAAAREAEVPFLSVRAVLDTANQRLPSYLLGLADREKQAALVAVAMPWRVPTLLRLAQQMRLAQERLAKFALSFIARVQGLGGYMA